MEITDKSTPQELQQALQFIYDLQDKIAKENDPLEKVNWAIVAKACGPYNVQLPYNVQPSDPSDRRIRLRLESDKYDSFLEAIAEQTGETYFDSSVYQKKVVEGIFLYSDSPHRELYIEIEGIQYLDNLKALDLNIDRRLLIAKINKMEEDKQVLQKVLNIMQRG